MGQKEKIARVSRAKGQQEKKRERIWTHIGKKKGQMRRDRKSDKAQGIERKIRVAAGWR